jgi:hypothetical protein
MFLSRPSTRQRGASIFSMLILAIIVGFCFLLAARTFPSVNEYLTIRKVVGTIMRNNPSTPAEIRNSFDKATEVEYSIKTISGKDLDIQPVRDGLRTKYDYHVEIEIVDPVYLLVKYSGSATTPGAGKGP